MATTNFSFTQLSGSETAGYTSINTLINSIDTILKERVFAADLSWASAAGDGDAPSADEVMVFTGTWGTNGYWKASKILAANIQDGVITGAKIASGTITADKLDAGLTTQILPAGMIAPFAGSTAPSGWLMCDGTAKSRTTYAGLFAIIDTTYGNGDGSTTFNLPDMSGRIPVGKSGDTEFDALGETGGVKSVTLTSAQSGVPAHAHTATAVPNTANQALTDPGHAHSISDPGHAHSYATLQYVGADTASGTARGRYASPTSVNTGGSGTGIGIYGNYTGITISNPAHTHTINVDNNTAANAASAHTNLQPYITLNYIIKT